MSKVLGEYFHTVRASDAYDYQYGELLDFVTMSTNEESYDWIITNPPFRLAEEFVLRALSEARKGVAILARSVFLESVGRYDAIFRDIPPTKFAQFSERVPMVRGRLDRKASTATGYAWLVWEKERGSTQLPRLMWIPPCRKRLERAGDYENPLRPGARGDAVGMLGSLL
ncbi:SAM-dependent methyltransferase [Bradyrhizobium sp. AZCC 1610]|uniref:SAM-dependent methyltransferase n=1 Tax=Bradyrhizobium sp. AZCC 1610 TaxID=3117020 RepID=UPI002FF34D50